MRKLALTLALAFGLGAVLAGPASACGMKNSQTVKLPISETNTAQTPIPADKTPDKG